MPTADAKLLPPPYERGSVRRLDEVGVETVLGAMIEQKRRASQPSYPAMHELASELANANALGREDGDDAADDDGPATSRAPTRSEVFLKSR